MIGRSPGSSWSRWSDSGHLALDAMVAFVDGELGEAAAGRAAAHVDHCPSCAGEVAAQRQARRRLRSADAPGVPSALLTSLRNIPDSAELPEVPAGLGVDAHGRLVVPAEAPPAPRGRGRRGSGAPRSRRRVLPAVVASGLVAGAAAVAGPVLAAGAVPALPTSARTPAAGASLTAAVPAVGERGNPAAGAVVSDAVARAAGAPTSSTTPPPGPTDATRARPSS